MEFPGRIWPLLVVFKAANRGMTLQVMICRVKMFCCWWLIKPTVSPVITMAIHTFVQWTFGFSYVLFVATAARDQIHNTICCAVWVLSQSYSGSRRWLHSASRGYHFAALTSFSATGRHSPFWLSSLEFGLSRTRSRKSRRLLGRLKVMTDLLW